MRKLFKNFMIYFLLVLNTYSSSKSLFSKSNDDFKKTIINPGDEYFQNNINFLESLIKENQSLNGYSPFTLGQQEWSDHGFLTALDLSNLRIDTIPADIENLVFLKKLIIKNNNLKQLPDTIINLINLNELDLSFNEIKTLPVNMGNLIQLKKLVIWGNHSLTKLPDSIVNISILEELELYDNRIIELPKNLFTMPNLKKINLMNNPINSLPNNIGYMEDLIQLNLYKNALTSIPESICNLNFQKIEYQFGQNFICPPFPSCINLNMLGENQRCFNDKLGDTNQDNEYNIFDILLINQAIFHRHQVDSYEILALSDINKDKKINILDLFELLDRVFQIK